MKMNILILYIISAFLFASLAIYHVVLEKYLLSLIFGGILIANIGLIWDNLTKK